LEGVVLMATTVTLIDADQPTVTTAVDSYTSPSTGGGTRIIAFTASSTAGNATASYRVFIGLTATDATEIIPAINMVAPSQDTPFELIGHLIPAGAKLFVQVSAANTITFRVTGIEL